MIYNNLSYEFSNLSSCKTIRHFVSTRQNGVSPEPYDSLNLSFRSNDNNENVLKNRNLLFQSLNIPLECATLGKQTHSGNVVQVGEHNKGSGAYSYDSAIPNADALITNIPNICLMVLLADCSPIFYFDPRIKVIGIAHAGRMGVVNKVAINTLDAMVKYYGSSTKDIIVGIGPGISERHYNIHKDAVDSLLPALPQNTNSLQSNEDSYNFSLSISNKEQLMSVGVREDNIEVSSMCTFDCSNAFFSERHDGKPTGRFGAGILLKE